MCGIAGFVNIRTDESIIADMLDSMQRRGPDASGSFTSGPCTLLHQRLAIIDPENGRQPMQLAWGNETYTIVYNGELYNAQELKKTLLKLGHRFETHCDTEVVLHAFAQWAEGCLERMNGIFAFAVHENKRKKLFLARDRMGVKPLFYTLRGNGILFASEIKTILKHPDVDALLDTDGICQILLLGPGRIPGSGVLKNISELEPGCFGYFVAGKWNWKRYWKLRDREHTDSFPQTCEKVRELVIDSIQRQMVSDVEIGTFLSGGLDSSIISKVCADNMHTGKALKTFSVDYVDNQKYFTANKFQPNSDAQYIEIMREFISSDHENTILSAEELHQGLFDSVRARDLPGMADVDISLLLFSRQIRRKVKVALSGECADEIFGGYPWFTDPEVQRRNGFPWSQNIHNRASFIEGNHLKKIQAEEFVNDHYSATVHQTDILPGTGEQDRRIKEMVNLNFRWFMQTLLDRKDRMSMYNSLEVRVPFCDYRIAEYLYGVPWEYKYYQGREKGLLRYAVRDLLPDSIRERKKSPYPKTFDPQYLKLVSEDLRAVINDPAAPIHQIVSTDALSALLTSEQSWPWYGQLMRTPQTIAYMLQLNHWMELYHVNLI